MSKKESYRVKLLCPTCQKDLSFDKPKNRVSPHYVKCLKLAAHANAGECEKRGN